MAKNLCFLTADILLPKKDFERFSVIACDQFTSEPDYWDGVKEFTNGFYTALDLVLPEIYLKADNSAAAERINGNMARYLSADVFNEVKNSFIYVERVQSNGVLRQGLIGKIDLKEYSYLDDDKGSIRSTEKTVLERIPPRADIRRGAAIELPHVMLLFDDREDALMSALKAAKPDFSKLYDFTLYADSGSIKGYRVSANMNEKVINILSNIERENNGLLFCVGDGNHSLAAAKSIYEQSGLERDRYALVEIVNIHSPAIEFEPIYRVVFGVDPENTVAEFEKYFESEDGEYTHEFRCVSSRGDKTVVIRTNYKLPVAALQEFLDGHKGGLKIDYIHGTASVEKIAREKPDRLGFVFEGMKKEDLFEAVTKNGSLPRKTFSLGHAQDKRFYLEARKIK